MPEGYMTEFERELTACLEPAPAPASLWYRVEANLNARPTRSRSPLIVGLLATMSLMIAWYVERPSAALKVHGEFLRHPERLDLVRCQPVELHDWIAKKTGLVLTVAARPPARLELVGARRLETGKAAVFYRVGGYPVTLVVAKGGGDRSQAKTIREERHQDARIFTWVAHGQRYTLVSSLPGDGRQACGLCHLS